MDKLLLIDGNSLTYRAYYGSAFRGVLTNSSGQAVNAILTLNRMLRKTFREYNPTHVFVAFDAGKHTFRHDMIDDYKGGRSATPPELISQFPLVKEMIDKMGIQRLEISDIEADDIIGSLAKRFCGEVQVEVLSSDKDLLQLVGQNVSVISPQNGQTPDKLYTSESFFEMTSYHPNQVMDLKGLAGDSSDNLPGVKGIGDKGAIKLLSQYQTLDGIYENISSLSAGLQEKLTRDKEMAYKCKLLATLKLDVEIDTNLDKMKFENNITDELIAFFEKYEITSLVKWYTEHQTDTLEEYKIIL